MTTVTPELIDFHCRRARGLRAAMCRAVFARLGDAFRRLLVPVFPRGRGDASAVARGGDKAPAAGSCEAGA